MPELDTRGKVDTHNTKTTIMTEAEMLDKYRMYPLKDLSKEYMVSVATLRRWCRKREVDYKMFGGEIRILPKDLEKSKISHFPSIN